MHGKGIAASAGRGPRRGGRWEEEARGNKVREDLVVVAQEDVLGVRVSVLAVTSIAAFEPALQSDDAAGVSHGQCLQGDRVHRGEECRVDTDSESERE